MFGCCSNTSSTSKSISNKQEAEKEDQQEQESKYSQKPTEANNNKNKKMPPPPPPPPPPPKPTTTTGEQSNTIGGATSALFAEIRDGGENITARLRHVKDEQKAYKQNIQHGAVDFSELEAKKAEAEMKRQLQSKVATNNNNNIINAVTSAISIEEPVLQLEGDKRWVVKHHKGSSSEPKKLTIDKVNMRHAVQIQNCEYVVIEIKGKVNSVSIVACNKVQVMLESVVSSLEVLKCEDVDVQVRRALPTASIEKSASVNLYLMDKDEALNTEVVTACSSTVNVNFPSLEDESEMLERPIPEQFVSKIVRDARGKYKVETKPSEI